MRKVAHVFALLGFIFAIIFVVSFFIAGISCLATGIINDAKIMQEIAAQLKVTVEQAQALYISLGVSCCIIGACSIVTIVFSNRLKNLVLTAAPEEIKGYAIGNIILGVVTVDFCIVAGILALCIRPDAPKEE